jgi:hypothetical protein
MLDNNSRFFGNVLHYYYVALCSYAAAWRHSLFKPIYRAEPNLASHLFFLATAAFYYALAMEIFAGPLYILSGVSKLSNTFRFQTFSCQHQ